LKLFSSNRLRDVRLDLEGNSSSSSSTPSCGLLQIVLFSVSKNIIQTNYNIIRWTKNTGCF
jgi:hypothetical protein